MSALKPTTTPAAGSSIDAEGGKEEAETLASEQVIELQAFIERREWIEDKIRVRHWRNLISGQVD